MGLLKARPAKGKTPVNSIVNLTNTEAAQVVGMVIIEPEERRFSLLGKVRAALVDGPQSVNQIVVGELTRGMRKAVETGKSFPWWRQRRRTA
jgi:hypothetical protein